MIQIKNLEKINVKNLFLVVQKYSLCFLTKEQVNFFGDAEQNKKKSTLKIQSHKQHKSTINGQFTSAGDVKYSTQCTHTKSEPMIIRSTKMQLSTQLSYLLFMTRTSHDEIP